MTLDTETGQPRIPGHDQRGPHKLVDQRKNLT